MKPLVFVAIVLVGCQLSLDAARPDDGPPPPLPPAVIARDPATHRATIRAVRLAASFRVDGRLDDEVYTVVPPISDFVQMEPRASSPATERTDLWIFFDDERVYVTFRCWESHPERMVVNEMRRDNNRLWLGENVAFMLDTLHDRRNGVEFGVTLSGGRYEGQVTNERWYNGDWNRVGSRSHAICRWLDCRDADPFRIAALSARARTGVGAFTHDASTPGKMSCHSSRPSDLSSAWGEGSLPHRSRQRSSASRRRTIEPHTSV